MNNDIDQVVQRTRQYWFSDGIVELSVGSLFLLLGIYFYLQSTLSPGSLLLISFQIGFTFLLIGGTIISRYLVNKFKSRLTTPRTGYVSYKRTKKKQRIVFIVIICLIAVITAALFLTTPLSMNWVPAFTGLIVGSIWLASALRVGLFRFYLHSILAYLLGVILFLTNLEIYRSLALFYGVLGCVMILSGGFTLTNYLREHPTIEEEPQTR